MDQIRKCIYYPLHPSLRGPKTFSLHNSTSKKDLRNGLKCSGWGWGGGRCPASLSPIPHMLSGTWTLPLDLGPTPTPTLQLCIFMFTQRIFWHKECKSISTIHQMSQKFFSRILFLASSSCYDLCLLLLPLCFVGSRF